MPLINVTINHVDDEESKKLLQDISKKLDSIVTDGDSGCVKKEILSKLNIAIKNINNIV